MKANEFVKRFGWDNSKECLRILRLRDTDFPFVCVCGDCTERDDLERLVESHELVEKLGGLSNCKKLIADYGKSESANHLSYHVSSVESCHVD